MRSSFAILLVVAMALTLVATPAVAAPTSEQAGAPAAAPSDLARFSGLYHGTIVYRDGELVLELGLDAEGRLVGAIDQLGFFEYRPARRRGGRGRRHPLRLPPLRRGARPRRGPTCGGAMSGDRPPDGPPGAAEAWWRAAEALPALDLPADRPRRPRAAATAGRVERRLAAAATASPEEALAAWAALLGRETGAGRFGLAASLAGPDAVLVEAAVEGDPSLADLALRLAAEVADPQRPRMPWRALPTPCGGEPGEASSVRVAFRAGEGRKASRAVGGEWVEDSPAGFDLALTWRAGEAAALSYAPDLFDAESAARFLAHFEALLAAARSDPGTPPSRLSYLAERPLFRS